MYIYKRFTLAIWLNLCVVTSGYTQSEPNHSSITQFWQQVAPVGEARLSILWWDIYDSWYYCLPYIHVSDPENLKIQLNATTGYSAKNSSNNQQSHDNASVSPTVPKCIAQAIKIRYLRDISQTELIEATKDEWEKLGINQSEYTPWLVSLKTIWPDLKKGDELVFFSRLLGLEKENNQDNSQFFYNNLAIGSIDSEDFSQAFLSIWLSPNTSQPKLRRQLLGLN